MPIDNVKSKLRGSPFVALGILLVLTVIVFAVYDQIQPWVNYPEAPLFDGNQYLKIISFLEGTDSSYQVSFPYSTRILVPSLIYLMPFEDTITSFKVLNLLFTLASLVALYFLWKHYNLSPLLIFAGFFWLLFHWTGIVRLNLFDPVTVDLPLYLFQTLLLLIVIHKKYYWLIVLAPVATAQKESFLALMVVLAFFSFYYRQQHEKRDLVWIGLALFLSLGVKLGLNLAFPPLGKGHNSLVTIAYHLKLVALDPFRMARWITAIFVAYGGFLILALQGMRQTPIKSDQVLLGLFSALYFLFGIAAGGDMLRIVFLGFPFVMTLLLIRLKLEAQNLVVVVLILSLPLMKLRAVIPDPVGSWADFAEWYPEYASWQIVLVWLGYALLLYMATLAWRRYKPVPGRT